MEKESCSAQDLSRCHSVAETAKEKHQLPDDYTTPGRELSTYSGLSLIRQRMLLIPSLLSLPHASYILLDLALLHTRMHAGRDPLRIAASQR